MAIQTEKTARLTLLATPIGRADDLTLHAIDVLKSADLLLAEDTRVLRKLLHIHGIALNGRAVYAYHEHNAQKQASLIERAWEKGQWIAYSSDAGTPLICDPGFELLRQARAHDVDINHAPGPSAVIAALCLSAQPAQRFFFGGFLPTKRAARQQELNFFQRMQMTGIYFESPKRLLASLRDIEMTCGTEQELTICREITKKFQDIRVGKITQLLEEYENRTAIKGEITLVLTAKPGKIVKETEIKEKLSLWLSTEPVKVVAQRAALEFGITRKDAYQHALAIKANRTNKK